MSNDRRRFIKGMSAAAFAAAFPASIKRALALPAHHRTGSIADVEHIVFLMQENRSFDHYFGKMRGVRGFGDPRAVKLPSGASVFEQPDGASSVSPFHPDAPDLGLEFLAGLPHGWNDTQAALNKGKYDRWIPNKSATTMAYLERKDIPFFYALADAFTVCDAYYCSFPGSTDPNRYHMWTGWLGNDGKNGGPVLNNAEAGYDWSTYPERLARNGISWKIYQDVGAGLDAAHFWGWGEPYVGNYGDNALLYFHQYQSSRPGDALYEGALRGTDVAHGGTLFDQFRADVAANRLPQVSWIVAPEAYTEHPNWPPNYGAWYVSQILDALTANPEVWSKTAFFLMYDENDGFFDHLVPPAPPESRDQGISTVPTTNEIFAGNASFGPGAIGLGVRVPMIVISPWSRGGWVNSEVFDHTSLIRFIEARFARRNPDLVESNITPWRRAVTGDLTSAFDFRSPNASPLHLPDTTAYEPPDRDTHPDYVPVAPGAISLPKQEHGIRPARALPYELHARSEVSPSKGEVELHFRNSGKATAVFQVRAGKSEDGPWTYTVGHGERVSETWALKAKGQSSYDLSVHGPNGFFRAFKGGLQTMESANLAIEATYDDGPGITLELKNRGPKLARLSVRDAYTGRTVTPFLAPGRTFVWHWPLEAMFGWYDLAVTVDSDPAFLQQLAGHVENGKDSASDPLLGV